jgi:hypothetical protein
MTALRTRQGSADEPGCAEARAHHAVLVHAGRSGLAGTGTAPTPRATTPTPAPTPASHEAHHRDLAAGKVLRDCSGATCGSRKRWRGSITPDGAAAPKRRLQRVGRRGCRRRGETAADHRRVDRWPGLANADCGSAGFQQRRGGLPQIRGRPGVISAGPPRADRSAGRRSRYAQTAAPCRAAAAGPRLRPPAEDLLSSEAASAAHAAFNRLASSDAGNRFGGPRARPRRDHPGVLAALLKAWLDDNLPGLVERLVREEIERVARPGR